MIRRAEPEDDVRISALRRAWTEENHGSPIEDSAFEDRFTAWSEREREQRVTWLAFDGDEAVGMLNMLVFERMPGPDSGTWPGARIVGATSPTRTSCRAAVGAASVAPWSVRARRMPTSVGLRASCCRRPSDRSRSTAASAQSRIRVDGQAERLSSCSTARLIQEDTERSSASARFLISSMVASGKRTGMGAVSLALRRRGSPRSSRFSGLA